MKPHTDIRSHVLPWIEQRLDAQERNVIDRHIEKCLSCREYFDTISSAVLARHENPRPALVPDPYLPTRIKALAGSTSGDRPGVMKALAWGWRSAALVVAVLLGVYMGEQLSMQQMPSNDRSMITAYSAYLEDGGLAERIQTLTQTAGEDLP